jgi:hypothetical protein
MYSGLYLSVINGIAINYMPWKGIHNITVYVTYTYGGNVYVYIYGDNPCEVNICKVQQKKK